MGKWQNLENVQLAFAGCIIGTIRQFNHAILAREGCLALQ